MSIPSTEEFLNALRELQLDATAEFDRLQSTAAHSVDADSLAKSLVDDAALTMYQAKQILCGDWHNLVLGEYCLLEPLGKGGMGQVFKARHRLMNRIVAVKIIRQDLLAMPKSVARFRREIELAGRLSHPNIVTAYDAKQVDGRHFLVMEYCDGRNLGEMVRENGPLPVHIACNYVRQTALGLQHAHDQKMIHRDIKPENLLLAGGVVKILDMGLARVGLPDDDSDLTNLTVDTNLLGTPNFMAPEQARNVRNADIRSDLYSLGCTFYFLLTGAVPFPGGTATEKLLRHELEAPEPLVKKRSEIPGPVVEIVERLMAKDPNDRYQTPLELANVLTPLAGSSETMDLDKRDVNTGGREAQSTGKGESPAVARQIADISASIGPKEFANTPMQPGRGLLLSWRRAGCTITLAITAMLLLAVVPLHLMIQSPVNNAIVRPPGPDQDWPWVISHIETVNCIAFSPNGKFLAFSAGNDLYPDVGGVVKVYDVATRKMIATLKGHDDEVRSLAFSPDGKILATAGADLNGWKRKKVPGKVILWDMENITANPSKTIIDAHPGGVWSLAFVQLGGGTGLATAGMGNEIKSWTFDGKRAPGTEGFLLHKKGPVYCLCVHPQEKKILASGGEDGMVKLWDTIQQSEMMPLPNREEKDSEVWCLAFSPDGTKLVAGFQHPDYKSKRPSKIAVWDLQKRQLIASDDLDPLLRFSFLEFTPDSKTIVVGLSDGRLELCDSTTLKLQPPAYWDPKKGTRIWSVAFSPGENKLVAVAVANFVYVWPWPRASE